MELMVDTTQKTLDSNYFEELVDKMVLDEIPGITQEFINVINGLPRSQKRMAILSILDKDLNLFRRIKALTDQNINKMEHIKDIILMLREYVKIGDVEKREFGEVMTPLDLVKEMLNILPEEVWSNPNLKWCDPANGTGPYPLMVIYKLMNGLREWEPDDERRYKHIVENMIYVCEIQPKNMFLYLCAIDPFDKYNINLFTGDFLSIQFDRHMKDTWKINQWDIFLGNPPYQKMDNGHSASAKPLYNLFIDKSIEISRFALYLIPSRWFAGGKGLDKFRKRMMESSNVVKINHISDNGQDLFGKHVNIGGGVSYMLIDKEYNGLCSFNNNMVDLKKYDIVLRDFKSITIIEKMKNFISSNGSLESISEPRSFYKIATNDKRLSDSNSQGKIKCYASQHKGFIKFIDNNFPSEKLNIHKVATPRALGSPKDGLGNLFYVSNEEVVTDSYMFLRINSVEESKSLISYLESSLVHYLVCLRKIDSSIKPSTFRWVPRVPLERVWTDQELYEYFALEKKEIDLIEKSKK